VLPGPQKACTPYSEEEASVIVRQLLLALAHLHSKRVAHCDVKPENLMFVSRWEPTGACCHFGPPPPPHRDLLHTSHFRTGGLVNAMVKHHLRHLPSPLAYTAGLAGKPP